MLTGEILNPPYKEGPTELAKTTDNLIIFSNRGEVDLTSITTFGVSVKGNESAIGFFGTGFKYAVSIILRLGGKISLYSGFKEFKFHLEPAQIRGKQFQIVHVNGMALGFTSEVGKLWKPWQAVRELYCNCIDEDEAQYGKAKKLAGLRQGYTTVVVQDCPEFEVAYDQLDQIMLRRTDKPIFEDSRMQIFSKPSQYLYYRGIKVSEFPKPSMFTYNVKESVDLTEDRTVKYLWEPRRIIESEVICGKLPEAMIDQILTAPDGVWESSFDFTDQDWLDPSEIFYNRLERLVHQFVKVNQTALRLAHDRVVETLSKRPGMGMTETQREYLDKAIKAATEMGFPVDSYRIKISPVMNPSTYGTATRLDGGIIYLNSKLLDEKAIRSEKQIPVVVPKEVVEWDKGYMDKRLDSNFLTLLETLIEEYIHLRYDLDDETRNMQNFIFRLAVLFGQRAAECLD